MIDIEDENQEILELLKSINAFYKNKLDGNENILIKYLNNREIIKDNKTNNLSLFIEELSKQIRNGNNIILPFIDPCYDLIEAYINSDNENIDWDEIFTQLIENSFMNRKILIPIYAYFTELYSSVDNMTESDEKMEKFPKMTKLWNLLYSYDGNKIKNSFSTFCFMGTGLEIQGFETFPENIYLEIKIEFLNNNPLQYIKQNDDFISTEYIHIQYSELNKGLNRFSSINIKFMEHFVEINADKNINGEKGMTRPINQGYKKVTILNNFYGEIKSIEILMFKNDEKNEKYCYSRKLSPFPLKNNGGTLFHSNYKNTFKDNNAKIQVNKNFKIEEQPKLHELKIEIKDCHLLKVNYIIYKEEKNIIDYFGGINQFLPFLKIVNGLYRNKNIENINNKDKDILLVEFIQNVLLVLFHYLFEYDEKQIFKKYWKFFLYLFNKIQPLNSDKSKINSEEFEFLLSDRNRENSEYFSLFYHFLIKIYSQKQKNENSFINLINNINYKETRSGFLGKTNDQLYRQIMKQLFIYNRLWSKQYLFFKTVPGCYKSNKKEIIKYKRINYYTSNFQQPLIYPILELNNYYPKFKKFDKNNLYKNKDNILNGNEENLDYDFSLERKNILEKQFIEEHLEKYNIHNSIKCCLIKKMYHIQGEIGFNKEYEIFFSSCNLEKEEETKEKGETEIIKEKGGNENKAVKCSKSNQDNLCYGSVFPCLEKDKKRIIFIPKNKIMFAIRRIYYYRPSGLEIFTSDNKSYYFNFCKSYSEYGIDNDIIKYLSNNFKPIIQSKKIIIGWYNDKYSRILNPLFNDNIDEWSDRNNYYSNFDKLMIINLFSNRSFNDIYQYPVFPMIYDEINNKRIMNQPIGFQELTKESIERKQLIIDSYNYAMDEGDTESEIGGKHYFNLFFSNITYTCNYLIRVIPYSFIAIEYQGNGFDDPNRLFFSIKSTMYNTLNERADLRELIPEIFYFPQLFRNINDFEFGKLRDGKEIDCIVIHDFNENSLRKYKFLKDMRESLEKEETINEWIDLVFGVNKEYYKNDERYYSSNSNVYFVDNPDILNNELLLQSYDFGVLPYQLLNKKFPRKKKDKELEKKLKDYNLQSFDQERFDCLIDLKISHLCKGEKSINDQYLVLINGKKSLFSFGSLFGSNEKKDNDTNDKSMYLFSGDVFGNLFVYKKKRNICIYNNNSPINEVRYDKQILNDIKFNYTLMKTLTDHTNEIKYIDYNPRLNLLVDYALDGYINLYTMPTLKLVLSIQAKDFDINELINIVVLISNPFPMICCVTLSNIIVFDINGKLINKVKYEEGIDIKLCIDKNCGLFNDYISYIKDGKEYIFDLLKEQ